MSEREELIERIATLEAERIALLSTEQPLHDRFMAALPGSDDERALGRVLHRLCARIDQIGRALDEIEAKRSRREKLADTSYGMNP